MMINNRHSVLDAITAYDAAGTRPRGSLNSTAANSSDADARVVVNDTRKLDRGLLRDELRGFEYVALFRRRCRCRSGRISAPPC